jgi:hypothetical protein
MTFAAPYYVLASIPMPITVGQGAQHAVH